MKKIFDKYFPLFNWSVYRNGVLMIEDPRKLLEDAHIEFFVENQAKETIKTMEFSSKNNYRIVCVKSSFYNKMQQAPIVPLKNK